VNWKLFERLAEQIEAEVVRQYFSREKIRPIEAIRLLGKGKSPNRSSGGTE
jgi:hypothetical protein